MSRPIYEPSLPRADAELGYGNRQLFRRPGPRGAIIPYFRAWQYDMVGTLIPDGGDPQTLAFDRWETSDDTVFDPVVITSTNPDTVEIVLCLTRGLYVVNYTLRFDDTPTTGTIGMAIEETAGGSYKAAPMVIQSTSPLAGDGTTGEWSMSLIRSYPPIWVHETTDVLAPATPDFYVNCANKTGADLTTFSANFEVHRLTAYDYEEGASS